VEDGVPAAVADCCAAVADLAGELAPALAGVVDVGNLVASGVPYEYGEGPGEGPWALYA
jgi:hypothetical protein